MRINDEEYSPFADNVLKYVKKKFNPNSYHFSRNDGIIIIGVLRAPRRARTLSVPNFFGRYARRGISRVCTKNFRSISQIGPEKHTAQTFVHGM